MLLNQFDFFRSENWEAVASAGLCNGAARFVRPTCGEDRSWRVRQNRRLSGSNFWICIIYYLSELNDNWKLLRNYRLMWPILFHLIWLCFFIISYLSHNLEKNIIMINLFFYFRLYSYSLFSSPQHVSKL